MLRKEKIAYYDQSTELEAFYAYHEDRFKKPAVLVVHDWSGRNEFANNKAIQLAELGYVGFAIDIFGKGVIGQTKEEKSSLIQPFMQNRNLLLQRLNSAFEAAKQIDVIDENNIGIIGFCFGGLCALDLARSGADLKAAVSFHGLLDSTGILTTNPVKAKIMALHGFDDPMVTPDKVMAFGKEMTEAKADWQLNMYSQSMHAFMNPEAYDPDFGTVYNPKTESRAWLAMQMFLKEAFAG